MEKANNLKLDDETIEALSDRMARNIIHRRVLPYIYLLFFLLNKPIFLKSPCLLLSWIHVSLSALFLQLFLCSYRDDNVMIASLSPFFGIKIRGYGRSGHNRHP